MEELKTINQWEKELGVEIINPDGFDRSDAKLYERLFTKEEFQKALMYCTININLSNIFGKLG